MLEALANAWRVPDLRRKLMFTATIIALYRLGAFVPLPGVDAGVLARGGIDTQNSVSQLFGVFTGGAFNNLAVFSLGIMPYITAAIVMNLMTVAIPKLQELAREGDTGQQKITQYTRYFTLALAFIQSIAMALFFTRSDQFGAAVADANAVDVFLMIVTLTAGVMLIMWMGEQISQRGLGNGISLIITASIISQAPRAIRALWQGADILPLVVLGIIVIIIVAAIVFVNEGQRRIPITYARRQVGRKMSQGGSTYLPLKVNMAGVIPIIFASSLLIFPTVLTQFASGGNQDSLLFRLAEFFGPPGSGGSGVPYLILYAMLIVMFTYFYTAVQFNPVEHADNLKKSGGYVPGYRPGRPTAEYLNTVLTRVTLFGAFFLAAVAVLPYLITPALNLPSTIFIGGTSILIVVGVSLDTVRQLESQLMMRNYEGFLKKGK
ncbi:preprotein translocase subunit SecY [soil metagenome]